MLRTSSAVRLELQLEAELTGHTDRIWHVAWSPGGTRLASCGADKTVRIWTRMTSSPPGSDVLDANEASKHEVSEWFCEAVLEDAHQRTIRKVDWSPNGRRLACASFDSTISIWEAHEGQEWELVATLEGHEHEVKALAWSEDGTLLASCSRDKSVWLWAVQEEQDDFECLAVLHGHSQDVKSLRWRPGRAELASASYDDTVRIWCEEGGGEADEWGCKETLQGHRSTVWDLAFDSTGMRLATVSEDRALLLWQFAHAGGGAGGGGGDASGQWRLQARYDSVHQRAIYSVDWRRVRLPGLEPALDLIATAGGDDALRLFRALPEGAELVASYEHVHQADVNCVRFHPTTPLLASASDDLTVRLWRLRFQPP